MLVYAIIMLFTEREERELTHLEEALYENIAAKLSQPLFLTDMRFGAYSSERTATLLNDFAASLETLNSPGFQILSDTQTPIGSSKQQVFRHAF